MPHQIATVECTVLSMTDGIVRDKLDSSGYLETEKEHELGRWSVKSKGSLPSLGQTKSTGASVTAYLLISHFTVRFAFFGNK